MSQLKRLPHLDNHCHKHFAYLKANDWSYTKKLNSSTNIFLNSKKEIIAEVHYDNSNNTYEVFGI